jgi:hypothetical protein
LEENHPMTISKMAAKLKIEKRGDEILKNLLL